jgi:hypothetical protein
MNARLVVISLAVAAGPTDIESVCRSISSFF